MENLFIYGSIHNFYMFVLLCFTCAVAITPSNEYIALEGEDVELVYRSDDFGRIFKDTGENSTIIYNGHLEGNPNKYGYSSTVSDSGRKHTLIIKNIDRNEAGVYSFMQEKPFKIISVTVLVNYRPSNLICSSSQKLIFFKDDVTNATAVLQCSLGDIGLPKSTLSFQVKNGSVNSSVIISGNGLEASTSILPSVRMNNSYISCIVRQDIPSSMSITSFKDSCSFPPILFLEELQVIISPSMYTMNDSGNITFTCSSNAGPLDNVTWKIKSEVPNSATYFAKHDQITFQVNNSKRSNNASIVFECFGKIQNHSGGENADLVLQHSPSESNLDSLMYSLYVALLVIVLFCVIIVYSFLKRTRKHRMDLRDDESPTDSKKKEENGRNVSHIPPRKCDDDKMSVVNSTQLPQNVHQLRCEGGKVIQSFNDHFEEDPEQISEYDAKKLASWLSLPSTSNMVETSAKSQRFVTLDKFQWSNTLKESERLKKEPIAMISNESYEEWKGEKTHIDDSQAHPVISVQLTEEVDLHEDV